MLIRDERISSVTTACLIPLVCSSNKRIQANVQATFCFAAAQIWSTSSCMVKPIQACQPEPLKGLPEGDPQQAGTEARAHPLQAWQGCCWSCMPREPSIWSCATLQAGTAPRKGDVLQGWQHQDIQRRTTSGDLPLPGAMSCILLVCIAVHHLNSDSRIQLIQGPLSCAARYRLYEQATHCFQVDRCKRERPHKGKDGTNIYPFEGCVWHPGCPSPNA